MFTLLPFQEQTAGKALAEVRLSMEEVARVGAGGSGQAVTLVAPTGAGKTVMAAALLEALFFGDETTPGDEGITVVWLSDLPNVNDQTLRKINLASDRLTLDRLVPVDNTFKDSTLTPGRVYFLNTQKLSATSNLVETADNRSFTIWDVINATIARDPSRFVLIIDEAHRGMERTTAATAEQASSITQRFILGSAEMTRSPIVLGISATPQRFDDLVAGAHRTIRRAEADIAEVRASGLIKERIVVWRPEHGLVHSETTLLQRAAQSLQTYETRWARYATDTGAPRVVPIMVVQVEDKTADSVSATDLQAAIEAIEEVTGALHPDAYAHSFGDAPAAVTTGSRKIRYIRPADIDSDTQIRVVFFKTSLSTGWDCPRAEVIMSFRTAKDMTFIAQLVGRMVRTPLARRIDTDDVLNSVALYLPRYDRTAVQNIVKQLRSGDPDYLPPVEVEEGEGLITCDRDEQLYSQVETAARAIKSYTVPRARRMPPVPRLEKLAGSLSDHDIVPDAPTQVDAHLVDVLWTRLAARRSDAEFETVVQRSRKVALNSTTLNYLTGVTDTKTIQVESTARTLERVYEQVGLRVGGGLHEKLWRRIRDEDNTIDGDTARLYVIATLGEAAAQRALDDHARQLFDDWVGTNQDAIDVLDEPDRQEFDQLLEHADAPTAHGLQLPTTVFANRNAKTTDYPQSLFQDTMGHYPSDFNSWETGVLEAALSDHDTVCWVRNKPRARWALCVPYEVAGQATASYPDFLFFRRSGGNTVVDLIDPHGIHLPDAAAKARGMALYAQKHGSAFGRIHLVIYDKDTSQSRVLDIKQVNIRAQVLAVTSREHLQALFDIAGT